MREAMLVIIKILKWIAIGFISFIILTVIGGSVYQAINESNDLKTYPAPGKLIDVDGHLMHIHCKGQGSPTVILELGVGSAAIAWYEMHKQLAQVTRVCAYDRAGLGYSEPFEYPRRAADIAELLHQLLVEADIKGELILIGWSAGGIYVREFYRKFPVNVKGMLLVDSSHEQQAIRMPDTAESGSNATLKIASYLAPIGLVRLSGIVDQRVESSSSPDELKPLLKAIYNQSHTLDTLVKESEAFNFDINATDPPDPIGDLPLIVITQGKSLEMSETKQQGISLKLLQLERKVRNELQQELTALSTKSKQIIAHKSGHHIYKDQPALLVESLTDLVKIVRLENRE